MAAPKGTLPPAAGMGRPKGCLNKTTAWLKDELLKPFDPVAFAKWAKDNPTAYYTSIVSRFIPKDIKLGGGVEFIFTGFKSRTHDEG
jgi:hypothetical protein